jgi:hypothetical protein
VSNVKNIPGTPVGLLGLSVGVTFDLTYHVPYITSNSVLLMVLNEKRSIERVEELKYLGTTLTYQNSIQVEIKSRLKLGNACYYSVQNLLSARLLS